MRRKCTSSLPPTAFRFRWPNRASTGSSLKRPRAWWLNKPELPIGNWRTKAVADRRASHGSNPTSSTICARSANSVSATWWPRQLVSLSDHIEVLYDLDIEAKDFAIDLGMTLVRAATVGTHPVFLRMIRELITERMDPVQPKLAIGRYKPNHDVCPADCCPAPVRVATPGKSSAPGSLTSALVDLLVPRRYPSHGS